MISQFERPSRPTTIARHSIKASGNSSRHTALCRMAEKEGKWLVASHGVPRVALV